jgi:hypothetical protein
MYNDKQRNAFLKSRIMGLAQEPPNGPCKVYRLPKDRQFQYKICDDGPEQGMTFTTDTVFCDRHNTYDFDHTPADNPEDKCYLEPNNYVILDLERKFYPDPGPGYTHLKPSSEAEAMIARVAELKEDYPWCVPHIVKNLQDCDNESDDPVQVCTRCLHMETLCRDPPMICQKCNIVIWCIKCRPYSIAHNDDDGIYCEMCHMMDEMNGKCKILTI